MKFKELISAGTLIMLAASQAHAQPGSEVCGLVALTATGNFALAYESRKADVSDKKQCHEFIDKVKHALNNNAKFAAIKDYPWSTVGHGTNCENLGKNFVDGQNYRKTDMCDYMQAKHHGYLVKMIPQVDASGKPVIVNGKVVPVTTYTKL